MKPPATGLLVIQFWDGDKANALRLARFIADLEARPRNDVDVLFLARHDAKHNLEVMKHVARKFNVYSYTTPSHATGHLIGSWAMWHSIAEWVYHKKLAGQVPDYKWIFPFEGDCSVLRPDWINEISKEWDESCAYVLGSEVQSPRLHINGNLVYSGDRNFLQWLVMQVTSAGVPSWKDAWDIFLFPHFVRWGAAFSNRILSVCGKRGVSDSEWAWMKAQGYCFVHGEKTGELFQRAQKELLPNFKG